MAEQASKERILNPNLLVTQSASLEEVHRQGEQRLNTGWLLATVVFILTLILYVATMSRTVFWWDTGELAANAKVLGIAHRPGFPLYVLVGHVFGMAPFGEYFYRVNFISAVSAAAALGILAYVWFELIVALLRPRELWEAIVPVVLSLVALTGTYTLWIQAVRAEVYAPTFLILALLIACAWGCERSLRAGRDDAARWLVAGGFLTGLGLALHHATLASALPALLVLFLALGRRHPFGVKAWLAAGFLVLLGMSVYLYMPIRAAQNPPLNWGWSHASTAPNWNGVIGADAFRSILATHLAAWAQRAKLSLQLFLDQLGWGLLLAAMAGAVVWWRRSRRWCLLALGIVAGNIAVTALLVSDFNDTNTDIHGYLLPALAALGFFITGGMAAAIRVLPWMQHRVPTRWLRRLTVGGAVVAVAVITLAPVVINAPFCNLVSNHLAYDLATEATAALKPGAIVFLAATNFDFVLRGLQYCDGWRTDVRIINRDLLPASWYRRWVFERYPELDGHPIPPDTVRAARLRVGQWARELAAAGLPVYWEFTETSMEMIDHLVPAGHLFAVTTQPVPYLTAEMIRTQEEFERQSRFYQSAKKIRYDYDAQMVYVANLYRAGIYYESRGFLDRARELFQRALSVQMRESGVRALHTRSRMNKSLGKLDSLPRPEAMPPLDPGPATD